MALGFASKTSAPHLPFLKYQSRDGRLLCIDNTAAGQAVHDITDGFAAVMDMDALQVGWMQFGRGMRPDMQLFAAGSPWPDAPGPKYKRGLRVVMQLAEKQGGEVRELSTTASSFLTAFDTLHDEFLAGRNDNEGKLPVVVLSGHDMARRPQFAIAGWVERPEALA